MRFSFGLALVVLALGVSACSDAEDESEGEGADVELESVFFPGSYHLSGTVTFASTLPAGTLVQLNLSEASDVMDGGLDSNDELAETQLSAASNQVSFRVDGIGAGSFLIALSAELSDPGVIGEGDQGGYYRGTTAQPAQYRVDATPIAVAGSLGALDFGAGPTACKAHWGDACSADADCRGASCVFDSGLRTAAAPGVCNAGACETLVASCDPVLGSAPGTLAEASCFGGP